MGEPVTGLRFLGPLQIEQEGISSGPSLPAKSLLMLAYLVRQPRPVARSSLAELLWPDRHPQQGRANVRWTLSKLSQLLPGCLETTSKTIRFSATPQLWLDTIHFERLLARGDTASLAEAMQLYRGEFMAGLGADNCPELELWLVRERQNWRQQVIQVLERLTDFYGQAGDYPAAQGWARQLLELEPWHEETHRQLMRLLALSGRRNAALAQYRRCRQVLAEALEVEPMPETVALYDRIRAGEVSNESDPPRLRGVLLAEAEGWAGSWPADFSPGAREFLQDSLVVPERWLRAEEAQRQPSLAQALAEARQRAEVLARTNRRLRWLLAGLALLLLLALGLGLLAISQCRQAGQAETVRAYLVNHNKQDVSHSGPLICAYY